MPFSVRSYLPSYFVRSCFLITCLGFFAVATASAGTQLLPCASDSQGKEIVFNTANGNPYHCSLILNTNPDGSEDVVINQPVVGSEAKNGFPYNSIVFQPGDLVTITADGCVQTAGYGSTWKRYVNPSGDESGPNNDNGIYFGTVTVVGGTTAHAPATDLALDNMGVAQSSSGGQMYVQKIQSIPGLTDVQILKLGYKDDNYDDHGGNGYWGHDNGDNNQCANTAGTAPYGQFGGPAWIKLHIVHNASNPFGPSIAKQWDLVPHGLDMNGLYLNPEWGWQVNGGQITTDGDWNPSCLPGCSSQNPSFDSAEATAGNWFNRFFTNVCNWDHGASGHHNFFDVTYTGPVIWVEHAGGAFKDDDYNMTIQTPIFHFDPPGQTVAGWGAGTTDGNNTAGNAAAEAAIGLEFDSDETIDHFDQNAWWHSFHQTTDGDATGGGVIDHHDAVVIGLMGFDEAHDTYTEIHPVHALAIREGGPPEAGDDTDPAHDRWAFFVRNWGDEGECSRFQHYLDANQITLQIPPPSPGLNQQPFGTAKLNTANTQVLGTGTDGVAQFYSGPEGTFVTFNLSAAVSQPFAFGEFELSWTSVSGAPPGGHRAAIATRQAEMRAEAPNTPEERLEAIWQAATPAQQQLYATLLAAIDAPGRAVASSAMRVEVQSAAPKRPGTMPGVSTGPATRKQQRDAARYQAMCAATGGKLPTQPTWCAAAKVPPVSILTTSGNPAGENGSRSPVLATLTVYDASGLGLGATQYTLDGKTWQTYSRPFPLPEGAYTLSYRSADKEGNMEDTRQHTANVTAVLPLLK